MYLDKLVIGDTATGLELADNEVGRRQDISFDRRSRPKGENAGQHQRKDARQTN
jgi:hypothetical protein